MFRIANNLRITCIVEIELGNSLHDKQNRNIYTSRIFVCVCVAFPYFETQTGNLLRHNVSKKDFHAQERDISMNGIGVINF